MKRFRLFYETVLRAPDDGSGANSGADNGQQQQQQNDGSPAGGPKSIDTNSQTPPGNQQNGQPPKGQPGGPAQQQQQQTSNNAAVYRPEGLPDDMLGANDKETIDKLFKVNKGFREDLSKRGVVPKDANSYSALTLPDPIAKKIGDLSKDKAFGGVREAALEAGVTDQQFGKLMPKIFEKFESLGLIPDSAPIDPEKAIGELENDHTSIKDPRERRIAASQRIVNAKATLDNLKAAGTLDDRAYSLLFGMVPDPADFRSLEKILALGGMKAVNPGGGGGDGGGDTEASILAMRNDPRYNSYSPKYDAKFREDVDARWKKLNERKNAA